MHQSFYFFRLHGSLAGQCQPPEVDINYHGNPEFERFFFFSIIPLVRRWYRKPFSESPKLSPSRRIFYVRISTDPVTILISAHRRRLIKSRTIKPSLILRFFLFLFHSFSTRCFHIILSYNRRLPCTPLKRYTIINRTSPTNHTDVNFFDDSCLYEK